MHYYATQSIAAKGDDGEIYTIIETGYFFKPSLLPSAGRLTCAIGPVNRLALGVYEIWVTDISGPRTITARTTDPPP